MQFKNREPALAYDHLMNDRADLAKAVAHDYALRRFGEIGREQDRRGDYVKTASHRFERRPLPPKERLHEILNDGLLFRNSSDTELAPHEVPEGFVDLLIEIDGL